MFVYANNCTEALMLSRTAFFALYNNYHNLEMEANDWRDQTSACTIAVAKVRTDLIKEQERKRMWRRIAIGEGVGIAVTVFAILKFF